MTRRPARSRRRTAQPRSLKRLALVAGAVLLAGIVGGPDLARRVYDAIDEQIGATSSAPTRTTSNPPARNGDGSITGPVTRVTDGDTFTLGTQRVRICGINTPERGETNYREAGDALRRIIDGRTVTCRQVGSGTPCDGKSSSASYDRIVAQCFVGSQDVAAAMVATGLAKDWERYSDGYYDR